MKPETFHPEFPQILDGLMPVVFGQGNDIMSARLLASIPLYTMYPEGSKKREKLLEEYWLEKDREYNEIKAIYDKYCFVGTVFKGNTSASAKITKIVTITPNTPYVCYAASDEHRKEVETQNKTHLRIVSFKPVPSGNFTLKGFLAAIKNKTITIVSVPEEVKELK